VSYHDLSSCTLTDDERVAEKDRILRMLLERTTLSVMTPTEAEFIGKMDDARSVSVKQLFYLRDINEKY
jgi:hypothetical protein